MIYLNRIRIWLLFLYSINFSWFHATIYPSLFSVSQREQIIKSLLSQYAACAYENFVCEKCRLTLYALPKMHMRYTNDVIIFCIKFLIQTHSELVWWAPGQICINSVVFFRTLSELVGWSPEQFHMKCFLNFRPNWNGPFQAGLSLLY